MSRSQNMTGSDQCSSAKNVSVTGCNMNERHLPRYGVRCSFRSTNYTSQVIQSTRNDRRGVCWLRGSG